MKKNEIVSLVIIALLLLAILAGAIYLGGRHRIGDKTPAIEPQTFRGYLYCQIDETLMRFDPKTDKAEKLCGHVGVDKECILENAVEPTQISDGRVYFGYLANTEERKYLIAYYDIESGKTYETGIEYTQSNGFFVYEGYIYFIDSTNIFRRPADRVEAEKIAECNYEEKIFMIADGKIYTYSGNFSFSSSIINTAHIYSYDLETSQKKEIYSFSTYTSNCINKAEYLDGRIYISIDNAEINAANPFVSSSVRFDYGRYLYVIDTKNDECNKLLEAQVDEYFLTENKIVYVPIENRTLPSDEYPDGILVIHSASIHRCDLDGKNDSVIYTNSDIAFATGYMSGGKLFGSFTGKYPGIENEFFYASLNLATGEIKEVVLPE